MRVFDHFNKTGKAICPVCGKNKDGKTVLIKIGGTMEGNVVEAKQVHLDCLDLFLGEYRGEDGLRVVIYQQVTTP